ncbi:MAG: sugar phosphate isomerase/epimerase family protein [Spirochaetia bacterium]
MELIASYWTIAGVFPDGGQEYSRFDFQDRVRAAARAGFTGLGLWHADLEKVLERRTLSEMKRILDDNGMRHVEVEFLTDWFLEGEKKARSDARRKMLLAAAEALNAQRVKVGDFNREKCSLAQCAESFAALCADAARHGTSIAFEPMRAAMLDTLPDSLRMVSMSGAKNGGIILDIWHVVDREMPHDEVSRIPREHLMGVELNDAVMEASGIRADGANPRRFCGEGDFDIRGFVRSVRKTGFDGPWGVEVFGRDLLAMTLDELAQRAFTTTVAQIED